MGGEGESQPKSHSYAKIISIWLLKWKIIKILGEKEETLWDLWLGKEFLRIDTKGIYS
jgi:hypothetical protein